MSYSTKYIYRYLINLRYASEVRWSINNLWCIFVNEYETIWHVFQCFDWNEILDYITVAPHDSPRVIQWWNMQTSCQHPQPLTFISNMNKNLLRLSTQNNGFTKERQLQVMWSDVDTTITRVLDTSLYVSGYPSLSWQPPSYYKH